MSDKWDIDDYQVEKVYKAEAEWDNPELDLAQLKLIRAKPFFLNHYKRLSNKKCRELIHAISDYYGIKCPRIFLNATFRTGEIPSFAVGHKNYIRLPVWAKTMDTICHEMAHAVTMSKGMFDAHGPIFCGALVEIVDKFMGYEDSRDLQWAFETNSVEVEYNNI